MAHRKKKYRYVTEKEAAEIMKRHAQGANCTLLAIEFDRAVGTINKILKRGEGLVHVNKTREALVKMNESPLTKGLKELIDSISGMPEIELITVEPKTRSCKVVVRKELDFTV